MHLPIVTTWAQILCAASFFPWQRVKGGPFPRSADLLTPTYGRRESSEMRREYVQMAAKVLDGKDTQVKDADKNDGMLHEDWGAQCPHRYTKRGFWPNQARRLSCGRRGPSSVPV